MITLSNPAAEVPKYPHLHQRSLLLSYALVAEIEMEVPVQGGASSSIISFGGFFPFQYLCCDHY